MKKSIVLILSVVMLFIAAPMRATAACDHCDHPVMVQSGMLWESAGYGYSHPYTTKDGKPAGCTVHIEKEYYTQSCKSCSFVRKIYTGNTRERHEKPLHE